MCIDVGSVRIGVARSDASGTLAVPEATLDARGKWLDTLVGLVNEYQPREILVGLPVSLDGHEHRAAQRVRQVVADIESAVPAVAVRLIDERLTTSAAHMHLREAGVSQRRGRSIVDQAAAVIMLQEALDSERSTGKIPGTPTNG